jgi:YfiH family protein
VRIGDHAPAGKVLVMISGTLGPGIRYAFTDRNGGHSSAPFESCNLSSRVGDDPDRVAANRCSIAGQLGLDPDAVTFLHQVHGNDVVVADGPWPDADPQADAMITGRPGLALAVLVADCTPVLVADPHARLIGAAHAGRPGLAAGVVPALLARLRELGATLEHAVAVIGPSVCGGCYEVPVAMQAEVAAVAPAAAALTRHGTPSLDIASGVAAQLRAGGVATVTRFPVCTMESADHFSYRREGAPNGRAAGYVWLEP